MQFIYIVGKFNNKNILISISQLLFIQGLILISFFVYTQQAALTSESSEEQNQFEKLNKRIDANELASIPLFRGSNLGIFVRKRPYSPFPEHSVIRRKQSYLPTTFGENGLEKYSKNNEKYQRSFDDEYAENTGPMFAR